MDKINVIEEMNSKIRKAVQDELLKIDEKIYKIEVKLPEATGYKLERLENNLEYWQGTVSALNEIINTLDIGNIVNEHKLNKFKDRCRSLAKLKSENTNYLNGKLYGFDAIYCKLYSKEEYKLVYCR